MDLKMSEPQNEEFSLLHRHFDKQRNKTSFLLGGNRSMAKSMLQINI